MYGFFAPNAMLSGVLKGRVFCGFLQMRDALARQLELFY